MITPSGSLYRGDALLLVDVQVDFCPDGALPVPEGDRVVPVLNRWLEAATREDLPVYATRHWHPPADRRAPPPRHCVRGSPGAAFPPGLRLPDHAVILDRRTHSGEEPLSAFRDTDLAARLAEDEVRQLWVGGLSLDGAVAATVLDAEGRGVQVVVIRDATRPTSAAAGERAVSQIRARAVRIETTA